MGSCLIYVSKSTQSYYTDGRWHATGSCSSDFGQQQFACRWLSTHGSKDTYIHTHIHMYSTSVSSICPVERVLGPERGPFLAHQCKPMQAIEDPAWFALDLATLHARPPVLDSNRLKKEFSGSQILFFGAYLSRAPSSITSSKFGEYDQGT